MRWTARRTCVGVMAGAVALLSGGCKATRSHENAAEKQGRVRDAESGFVYKPARWRLATFAELERTTIWVSHLAIRHEASDPSLFRALNWRPDPPNPKRSVQAARELADKLAAEVAADPASFARVARENSEDLVTRDQGGALGGVRASQLAPSGFLDALATLRPGEVSKAFRTPYGFHVVKREAPPAETTVAGERIVIGYVGTLGLGVSVTRTRDEARLLALRVGDEARAHPERFRALIGQYSDNADLDQAGDMGAFSTRDPEYLPLEVKILGDLRTGDVAAPLDSRFGFEVIRRVELKPRPAYAMTAIELQFDPTTTEGRTSQAQVRRRAGEFASKIASDATLFETLQAENCCKRVWRWMQGRGPVGFGAALEAIRVGEVATEPILWDQFYLIPRRLDPARQPPEPPQLTELPQPERPDFEALIAFNDGNAIAGMARSLLDAVQSQTRVAQSTKTSVEQVLKTLATSLERDAKDTDARRALIRDALKSLASKLTQRDYADFTKFAADWAVSQMMPEEPPAGSTQ
jgi:hypothetical protein